MNDDPGLTLTYFTARIKFDRLYISMGKAVAKSFNGKNLQQITQLTE